MNIREQVLLAPYTTFQIGGPARYFIEAHARVEIVEAIRFADEKHLPLFVLGGGSNILIPDAGFAGVVLHICDDASTAAPTKENSTDGMIMVTAGAGVSWDALVQYAVTHDLYGIENLSGIPGTLGGAVVANIGAYGAAISDVFVVADVLDLKDGGVVKSLKKEDCAFAYHESVFGCERGRYIICTVTLALSQKPLKQVRYADNRFRVGQAGASTATPTLAETRARILDIREEKGALAMPGRVGYKCAGSFFHMPFVSKADYQQVLERACALDPDKEERLRPWAWEQSDGRYKLAPGFLLEYTKFQKGYRQGRVGISPRHTLSIVNIEDGTASEIAALAHDMEQTVRDIFGVSLEREVEYVGEITSL